MPVAVLKTGGAAAEPGLDMAAVVGNMDGAAGAAEWADRGLISDTKLLWLLLDRGDWGGREGLLCYSTASTIHPDANGGG